jgi:hypothetical protein
MGHRTKAELASIDKVELSGFVTQPPTQKHWHPIAANWYESLAISGQSIWYEPSDWAAAQYLAEAMTRNLEAYKFSSQLFGAAWQAMNDLMTTEGSRRRLRLELERAGQQNNAEAERAKGINAYRNRIA